MGTGIQIEESHQCPLCESHEIRFEDSLSGEELLRLWRESGFNLAPEDLAPVTETVRIRLWHCQSCQFEFFDQGLTGTDRFYRGLSLNPAYYANHRPEFARTLKWVRSLPVRTVLDVGCGDGAFLDEAREAGLETYGIELNKYAREKARSKGHQVVDSFLQNLDTSLRYDLVVAFQVLEHVADPVQFLQLMARVVRPRGYLAVAVPNHGGLYRLAPLDPHTWPPHHVTRWTLSHLDQAGSRAGLKVVRKTADILFGGTVEYFSRLNYRLSEALGRPVSRKRIQLLFLIALLYRKSGMRYWLRLRAGGSIFALCEKPV
jgi:2-polyprenyl-3-methyl-5-hydroxy-6-metoxy-1,4-benzoquinol methylase